MPRDRTGEVIDDPAEHDQHHCDRGWIDRDAVHPRPCYRCRPWLRERRPPTPDELRAARPSTLIRSA